MKFDGRVLVLMMAVAGLALSGCVSTPTYGTDKSASSQLFDDFSNIASISGGGRNKERIDYKPRPDLVRPAKGDRGDLPAPQQSLAQSGDPQWPESPEQRRKRLRAEVTENQDNPNYVSPIISDMGAPEKTTKRSTVRGYDTDTYNLRPEQSSSERAQAYKEARKLQTQGSSTSRRYLSEPPLTYREPAASAAVGDLGQDEAQKERERKKAASGGGSSWGWLPWN